MTNTSIQLNASLLNRYMPIVKSVFGAYALEHQALYFGKYLENNCMQAIDGERKLTIFLDTPTEKIAFNGHIFADMIKNGSWPVWEMQLDGESVIFTNNKQKIVLLTMETKHDITYLQFENANQTTSQVINATDTIDIIELDAKEFSDSLKQIAFAIKHGSRPVLLGAHLFLKDKLILTTTDGYQIARSYIKNKKGNLNLILPQKTIGILLNLLECTKTLKFAQINEKFVFKGCDENNIEWIFESNVINGQFPNCDKFFQQEKDYFQVDAKAFSQAVVQAGMMSRDNKIVSLIFQANSILIGSSSVNMGTYQNEIEGVGNLISQNKITLNFKADLLDKILRMFKKEVIIHIRTNGPILFTSSMQNAEYVLVPLRV